VNGDRAFSDVLQDLLGNLQHLVRSEVRLARAEVREEAGLVLWAGMWLGLGVAGAMAAGMLLLWSVVFGLALVLPMWAATLVTGGVMAGVAFALCVVGRQRLAGIRPGPDRAIESIKEDLEWLKQSTR
jgi:hypothetical protein